MDQKRSNQSKDHQRRTRSSSVQAVGEQELPTSTTTTNNSNRHRRRGRGRKPSGDKKTTENQPVSAENKSVSVQIDGGSIPRKRVTTTEREKESQTRPAPTAYPPKAKVPTSKIDIREHPIQNRSIIYLTNRAQYERKANLLVDAVPFRMPRPQA